MIAFQGVIPTLGMGRLEPVQGESNFHKTEKERLLYSPRNVFWKNIADECVGEGIGISMFLGPSNFLDVASIGMPTCSLIVSFRLNSPQVTRLPSLEENFFTTRASAPNETHMCCLVSWIASYNDRRHITALCECAVRLVCSHFSFRPVARPSNWYLGLKVVEQYGNFYKRSQTDLEFGVLDADKSITVAFGHTATLDERQYACFQSAVLYTTSTGQRMVRTCNMALPVVSLAMNVFRYADEDAAIAYWFRKGVCSGLREGGPKARMLMTGPR